MRTLMVEETGGSSSVSKFICLFGVCDVVNSDHDAIEAFRWAHQLARPYNLLLLDSAITDIDPQETVAQIRQIETEMGVNPADAVNIIMATTLDSHHPCTNSPFRSCESFLEKPITRQKIYQKLEEMHVLANSQSCH